MVTPVSPAHDSHTIAAQKRCLKKFNLTVFFFFFIIKQIQYLVSFLDLTVNPGFLRSFHVGLLSHAPSSRKPSLIPQVRPITPPTPSGLLQHSVSPIIPALTSLYGDGSVFSTGLGAP